MATQRDKAENARKQSYREVLRTPAGRAMMQDLTIFSQTCNDPNRALGRADVVLRMIREWQRVLDGEEDTKQETKE